ncbi:Bicyclomycin resistance protein [Sulfitobacter sp. DSM 110093]|uniref:multidrug effflux MFS transporter n=1 Tax=Sulfitobacter TaxID=60136 RepID=UPI001FABE12B|nr:multidrug effflux MFS transporter [Sulfitobacter sp. DSM 110093]UOA30578.1 Bicyclomycin resistance protein [Sulfitobacter sp. DSM 110093]
MPHRETMTVEGRSRLILYALLTSLTAISIDAILPGLLSIEETLQAQPPLRTQHVVSLFIFGMVFGELLIGPASDAFGRKAALIAGLTVYIAGTVVAMTAASMEVLIFGRILQGIGVSGPKIATRAMIRDQFEGDAMARVMSFMFTLFILVPMIGPALGQGIIVLAGWRGVFVMYLVLALALGIWMVLRHPETLPPERRIPIRFTPLVSNAARILTNRRVVLLIFATGLVFGAQLFYLSVAAELFFDAYGIDRGFPLLFAILAAGIGLASYTNGMLVERFGASAMARSGFIGMSAASVVMLAACLLTDDVLPLVIFIVLGFGIFFAIGILFGNLNAMAMRTLGDVAGIGSSLLASGSSLVATLFALIAGTFYAGGVVIVPVAFLVAGSSGLLLTAIALRSDETSISATKPRAAKAG